MAMAADWKSAIQQAGSLRYQRRTPKNRDTPARGLKRTFSVVNQGLDVAEVVLSSVIICFMKNLLALAIVGAALVLPRALQAQSYSIDWYTIGGGGGTSSGTNGATTYSLSGTIGQPATSTMNGGNYSLTGGFWSIISAVQTPGSPILSITRSGPHAVISWNAPATGFLLEQSSTLKTNSWTTSPATLSTNAGIISVTVTATNGYQFFRLHSP
jgi:hypothetical protein